MNLRKTLVKHRKLVLLILIIIVVLIIFIYFTVTNKVSNSPVQDQTSNVSYPVLSQPNTVVMSDGYNFKNLGEFEFNKLTNLAQNFCDPDSFPNLPPINIDIDEYTFRANNDVIFSKVINHMDKYLGNSQDIRDAYDLYNKLLNNELTLENAPNSLIFAETLPRPCDTSVSNPIYINKISYTGTDNAYLLLFAGSTQSVVNHNYFPIRAMVISKIDNSYAIINNVNLEYNDLTKENNLTNCEVQINGFPSVNVFTFEDRKCVIDQFNKDIDETKLDTKISEMLEIFQIK
ncbi:MAG: hypothetical protein ACMG57_03665 [Candidatus Dojkabacteria bacterium]